MIKEVNSCKPYYRNNSMMSLTLRIRLTNVWNHSGPFKVKKIKNSAASYNLTEEANPLILHKVYVLLKIKVS